MHMKTTLFPRMLAFGLLLAALVAIPSASGTPTISITDPASGGTLASISTPAGYTITATAAATANASIASVQFFDNGSSIGIVGGTSPFSITWIPTAAGLHTLTAVVTDNSVPTTGTSPSVNTATATSIVMVTAVRTVSLVAPQNNATLVQNSQIFLRSNPVLSDNVISKVEYFLDPSGANQLIATRTQAPYSAEIDLLAAGGFTVGPHAIKAKVTAADNTTFVDSALSNINIASTIGTPPVVTLTSPTGGSSVPINSNVTVAATAADTDGFILGGVTFYVDGEPIVPAVAGQTNPVLVQPYTLTWKPTVAKTYALRAQASDDKGNIRLSTAINVTAANSVPTVLISSPVASASVAVGIATSISVTAAASTGASVTQVEFFANGVSVGTDSTSPFSLNWTPAALGAVSLTARVTDSAGFVANSSGVSVTIVSVNPSATLV
ncbi:MAG: putative b-glycosidase, glycoside hydrolase family 8 protein, partial [Verrucomicrobiota bacterium]